MKRQKINMKQRRFQWVQPTASPIISRRLQLHKMTQWLMCKLIQLKQVLIENPTQTQLLIISWRQRQQQTMKSEHIIWQIWVRLYFENIKALIVQDFLEHRQIQCLKIQIFHSTQDHNKQLLCGFILLEQILNISNVFTKYEQHFEHDCFDHGINIREVQIDFLYHDSLDLRKW